MRKSIVALSLGIAFTIAPSVFAQATRTWVSGVGDDANPCSRTAPCKTFAGAISKTAAGGEISVLDPGGYGALNITKSITLNGAGTLASILFSGTNGIIVNGAGIVVNIVDISLNGGSPVSPGINGIRIIQAAQVSVSGCDIFNWTDSGIKDERTTAGVLTVKNTRIHNSLGAATRVGIRMSATVATNNTLTADGVTIFGNLNNSSVGIFVSNSATASVTRSTFTANVRGIQTATGGQITVSDSLMFGNNAGVRADAGSTVRLSGCTITNNSSNGLDFAGGTIISFGNNAIDGNGGNNGAGLTVIARQ
jgi:hypothetical protein